MPSYVPIIKNSATGAIVYLFLSPRQGVGEFQTNPTIEAGDVKISLDGGAFVNLTTLPIVTPAGSKAVKLTLSQAETNADNIAILFNDQSGGQWCDAMISLQTAARQFDDLPTAAANATELLDQAAGVETNRTLRQAMRLMLAVLCGKSSGHATSTVIYRDTNDTKNRTTATVSAGDRKFGHPGCVLSAGCRDRGP